MGIAARPRSLKRDVSDLPYTVRRSDRARSVRVRVEHDGEVTVTLPRRARDREAAAAVRELRPWIDRRVADAAAARAAIPREPGTVPYLGGRLRLVEQAGRTRAHRRGDLLLVPAAGPEQRGGDRALVPAGGPRRGPPAPGRGGGGARQGVLAAHDPRPAHALGVVLGDRSDRDQLAPPPRSRGGARLRHLARGVPPRRDGPLARASGALLARHVPDYEQPRAWLRRSAPALTL